MAVTYEQLANALRQEYPGKYGEDKWSNEALAKRFLNKDPNLKSYVTDWESLYQPTADVRSEDYEFAIYQAKEQFQGIPEWFVGSIAAVTGSENLGAVAEEMRAESAQWTEDYLATNPEIAGYLKWIEEEPITSENWWHSEIFQRSLAQAAPSMATMIGTEIALWGLTGGVGGVINKARQAGTIMQGFKATNRLKAVGLGRKAATVSSMGVYEAAGEYSEAMNYLVDEKRMDPLDAQPIAAASSMIVGTINGVIEYMPYGMFKDKIFSGSAKKAANSRITRRVIDSFLKDRKVARGLARISEDAIIQGLAEGGQEWTQHMVQSLSQYAYKSGYGDTEETAFEEFIKQATSQEAIASAHAGGTMGVVMGTFAGGVSELSPRQRRAIEREDEITDEDITYDTETGEFKPLDEAAPVEFKEEEETLSRSQLVMRSFTAQNIKKMTRENMQKLERVEEELGDITSEDPAVKQNWKDAITDIVQEDPTALQDIPNRDQALRSIETEFGSEFRSQVEEAWEAPAPPEVAPIVPEVVKEEVTEAPRGEVRAPEEGEAPPPPEVGEIKTMEQIGLKFPDKKKAPVEERIKSKDIGSATDLNALKRNLELAKKDVKDLYEKDNIKMASQAETYVQSIQDRINELEQEAPAEDLATVIKNQPDWDEGDPDIVPPIAQLIFDKKTDLETLAIAVADMTEDQQEMIRDRLYGAQRGPFTPYKVGEKKYGEEAVYTQEESDTAKRQILSLLKETPAEVTPEAVHKAAEAAGMAWDDDADFMALSKKVTGKERIDDMTSEERARLIAEIEKAPAEKIKPLKQPMLEAEANLELNKIKKDHNVIIEPHPTDKNRIGMIIVPEDARGKGIGTQIFETIKKRSIGMGLDYILIEVADGDFKLPDGKIVPSPIGFWEKMGFVKTGEKRRDERVEGYGWVEVMKYTIPEKVVAPEIVEPSIVKEVTPLVAPSAIEPEPEIAGIIKEADPENVLIPKTGRWLRAERLFNRTWERVKDLYQKEYPNYRSVSERIAVEHYMDAMEASLPKWAQSGFLNWATKKFPLANINKWGARDSEFEDKFLDDSIVHNLVDVALGEISEGLEEIGKDRDSRYLSLTNTSFNKALGIVLTKEEEAKWYASTELRENNTPDKWIENTLEDVTGLNYKELSSDKIAALRFQYHSARSSIPTNRENSAENFHNNGEIVIEGGTVRLQLKRSRHFVTKKTNPNRTRGMLAGIDTEITWVSTNDIYEKKTVGPIGKRRVKTDSLYSAMTIEQFQSLNASLIKKGRGVIAFSRGDSSIAIANITAEHKTIASKESTYKEYWEANGMSDKQIENLMKPKTVNGKAAQIARYQAIKRYYPEFMEDNLPNVFKRLKIPFTPSIVANNTRDASVKIVDKDNISYVYPDGKVVSWVQEISQLDPLYAGDGGTPTSNDTFRHYNKAVGINVTSDVSKNVMYQIDDSGSLFVKHLMYKPQGPAQIYENYEKDNERLIGEIREDGNIYAYAEPKSWTPKRVDKLIADNNLANANATDIINHFTDEEGNGMAGLSSAAEVVLDDPKFEAMNLSTLNDKLEFIASKNLLLKKLVRKVANQGQEEDMELIDHIMTDDEAKVATKDYQEHLKNATTFTIKGQSIGYIQDIQGKHTKVKHNDQLYNYITDPGVIEAFRNEMLSGITRKINNVYRFGRGDVRANLSKLGERMRKEKDESIDDIVADGLEMGLGLHPTIMNWIDSILQSRHIVPAVQMENQEGIAEKIQWDQNDDLAPEELSVSSKNANIVYREYAADVNTKVNDVKEARKVDLKDINEWLEENEVWILAYRVPTPHVNGAGMMRIKSLHDSRDVVLVNPDTIFRKLEGDGDGDTLYMHAMSAEMTAAFRAFYSLDEIRKKVKGINLTEFTKQDVKEYDFSNINDPLELMHSLMLGAKGISEIAKIQRIYGQLLAINPRIEIDNAEITLRPPSQMLDTPRFKKGSRYSVEDILRIYLQAAVDNGKYMLLGKWGYKRDDLRAALWQRTDGKPITTSQFVALNALMDIHGNTGNIRSGSTYADGAWGLSKMIEESDKHSLYVGENEDGSLGNPFMRESYFRKYLANLEPFQRLGEDGKPYYPRIGLVEFDPGLSVQEEIVIQPALGYEKFYQTGESGSPFRFLGHDNLSGDGPNLYKMGHDVATREIDKLKEGWEVTEAEVKAGIHYATNMGNAFYKMFRDFKKNGIDPGFLGWSTNEEMINFIQEWQTKFNELSDDSKKIATFAFLEGIHRSSGRQQRFVHQLPPISKRTDGVTLLEPSIMEAYLKSYNETLMSEENRKSPKVRARSEFVALTSLMTKKGCK